MSRATTLLVGAAGTGRTSRLIDEAADLLLSGERVTIIARNRQTARSLRLTLARSIPATDGLTVTTVHALALGCIRRGWKLLGYTSEPALINAPEQVARVQEMLLDPAEAARWEAFPRARALNGFAADLRTFIARALDADESPERLAERSTFAHLPHLGEAAAFYGRYLQLNRSNDRIDHGTAIREAASIFQRAATDIDPALQAFVAAARKEAGHVFLDDLQALTPAMLRFVAALTGGSVTATSNPDAPGLAFRGGSERIEDLFQDLFWPVERVELDQRVRPQPLVTSHTFGHPADERIAIVNEIRRAHGDLKLAYSDIAIIVRGIGKEVQPLRRALERARIPVTVVGENRALHAEPALGPMLDLLDLALDPARREEVLPRVLASPMFGLDSFSLRELRRAARRRDTGLAGLVANPGDLHESYREVLLRVHAFIDELAEIDASRDAEGAWWWLWEGAVSKEGEVRFRHFLQMVESDDDSGLDAIEAFSVHVARACERRPGIRLSEIVAAMRTATFGAEPWGTADERRPDSVRILTPFGAAGRDFELVIVPNCVSGVFPSNRVRSPLFDLQDLLRPATSLERHREHADHEAKVFRSVIDRSRSRVVLTCAADEHGSLAPSPLAIEHGWTFMDEIPEPPSAVFTRDEMEALQRRRLIDPSLDQRAREEALAILSRLRGVQPETWWYEQDWTRTDPLIRNEPFRTSYSKLESYENCPLSYLYGSEAGLDPSGSAATAVGTWVHEVFERGARQVMDTQQHPTIEELRSWLDELWDHTEFDNAAVEHRRRLEAEQMLERWAGHDMYEPVLAVEQGFVFQEGPATIRGYIDRITGRNHGSGSEIIDYKTGNSVPTQDDVEESLQLAIYHLAIERDPEMARFQPVNAAGLRFIGKKLGRSPYVVRRFQPEPDFGQRASERLSLIVEGISSGQFTPSGEADCKWCRFKPLCPLQPEGSEVIL